MSENEKLRDCLEDPVRVALIKMSGDARLLADVVIGLGHRIRELESRVNAMGAPGAPPAACEHAVLVGELVVAMEMALTSTARDVVAEAANLKQATLEIRRAVSEAKNPHYVVAKMLVILEGRGL